MKIFDFYILRNLFAAMVFIALTLTAVIFLTQSLRFLELVIESGASSLSFWILTCLALPRFFEVIMPLSLMAATLFIYNRMIADSELVAIRAAGFSPLILARPALVLAMLVTIFLWSMTFWIAPLASSNMQEMRQIIKAQFSNFLFREGVFNQAGQGLTVYIRDRQPDGELRGLMIYDARDSTKNPSLITAKRGLLFTGDNAHEVLVYNGSRQEYDRKTKTLNRLDFERYTIELPDSGPVRERWPEPAERTLSQLLKPDLRNERDVESLHDFKVELHKRIVAPVLAFCFTVIACVTLLLGGTERRGQGRRIALAVLGVVIIQGLFLASFNLARQSVWGLFVMHGVVFVPLAGCLYMLVRAGYREKRQPPQLEVAT